MMSSKSIQIIKGNKTAIRCFQIEIEIAFNCGALI